MDSSVENTALESRPEVREGAQRLVLLPIALPHSNMEAHRGPYVVENVVFQRAGLHFNVGFKECNLSMSHCRPAAYGPSAGSGVGTAASAARLPWRELPRVAGAGSDEASCLGAPKSAQT